MSQSISGQSTAEFGQRMGRAKLSITLRQVLVLVAAVAIVPLLLIQGGIYWSWINTRQAEEDVVRAYNLHANCYITKPVDFEQFISIVKSIEGFWFSVVRLPNG